LDFQGNRFTARPRYRLCGGVGCALIFVSLGCIFVGRAGLQTDEAIFAAPLFRTWRVFAVQFAGYSVPLMNGTYMGALKTWLYVPVLWRPGPALIRVPAILIGAATILIFWALLNRVHSRRAAWVGCILLATDTSFLLTTTYDWGPVALQHLFLVAAMFLAVRWFQTANTVSLAAASFCCGLALWDKAVFLWVFTGLLAGLAPFASALRQRLTLRHAAIVAAACCMGALPLIAYNLSGGEKFATIRTNAHFGSDFTWSHLAYKLRVLQSTADGSALFGYLVNEDPAPRAGAPHSALERASFALHGVAGEHRRGGMALLFTGALLLLPLLWRTRARGPMLFCLIAVVAAWIHMAIATGGGSAHHAVLLWPLPHLFLAVGLGEASVRFRSGKWALAALVCFLATGNLLVTNQYLYQLIRNGPAGVWTDAIYALGAGLRQAHASQIVLPDWGMTDSLCVLNRGNPPTRPVGDPFLDPGESPAQTQVDLQILSDAGAIWVEHTPGHEIWKGVNERVLNAAGRAGFEPVMLQTYYDRNGRPIFQTLRFVPARPG